MRLALFLESLQKQRSCDLNMMGGLRIGICVRNQNLVLISLT